MTTQLASRSAETAPPAPVPDALPLRRLLREDFDTDGRSPLHPGLHALFVHRIGRRARARGGALGALAFGGARVAQVAVRNLYGIELPFTAEVGRRVKFAHQGCIVVNDATRIGDDCLIRHGVTLGAARDDRSGEAPTVEDGVEIGPFAVVAGPVTVGAGAKISPLALVTSDVPPGGRALAPRASIVG